MLFVRFDLEYVSESLTVDDVFGVWAEFLAETSHVDNDGVAGDDHVFPDAVHELLAREYLATVLEQQGEQCELSACEAGSLAVDGDGLAVEVQLQAAETKKVSAETCLDDVHHVVAQLLTFADDVAIERGKGVGVFVVACLEDALGFQLVTQRVDVALYFYRGVDGKMQ